MNNTIDYTQNFIDEVKGALGKPGSSCDCDSKQWVTNSDIDALRADIESNSENIDNLRDSINTATDTDIDAIIAGTYTENK